MKNLRDFDENSKRIIFTFFLLTLAGLIGICAFFVVTPEFANNYLSRDGNISVQILSLLNQLRFFSLLTGSLLFLFSILIVSGYFCSTPPQYFRIYLKGLENISEKNNKIQSNLKNNSNWISQRKVLFVILLIIVLGTGLRIWIGYQKAYYHLDGVLSIEYVSGTSPNGLADGVSSNNYNQYSGDDILALMSIPKSDFFNFSTFNNIIRKEPHPPLYYWSLHVAQVIFSNGNFSKWPGIILNIILYILSSIFIYRISRLFINDPIIAFLPIFLYAFIPVALGNTALIRMYEMLALATLMSFNYSMVCFLGEGTKWKNRILLSISIVFGLLTQYYYIIFMFWFFVYSLYFSIKNKVTKRFLSFSLICFVSGGIALLINPWIINHLFFGRWGTDAIGKVASVNGYLRDLLRVWRQADITAFWLPSITILLGIASLFHKRKETMSSHIGFIAVPVFLTFLVVAKVAPFTVMRYFSNLIPLLLIVFSLLLNLLIGNNYIQKWSLGMIFICLFISQVTAVQIDVSMSSTSLYLHENKNEIKVLIDSEEPIILIVRKGDGVSDFLLPLLSNKTKIFVVEEDSEQSLYNKVWKELNIYKKIFIISDCGKIDDSNMLKNSQRIYRPLSKFADNSFLFYELLKE